MRTTVAGPFILLAALIASSAFGQDATPPVAEPETAAETANVEPTDLAATLEAIRARHGVPAIAGAIVVGDHLTALGATGVRAKGSEEVVTVDDVWHLGSCTKALTATLIARLVERGDLAWDLTLEKAFPDVKNMDAAFRPVPLELLLGNRGGAPANLIANGLWAQLQKRKGTPRDQRRTLLEAVLARPPANEPGTTNLYSNAGFAIAGAAAERKLDAAWEDLLRKEVLAPLGMKSAGFGAPGTKDAMDQPRGHTALGIPVVPGPYADNPPAIGPAGTVHCTIQDWAKFVSAHLTGESGDGEYLKTATFKKLHTPLDGQEYAMGWQTAERRWAGGRALTHSGSNTMWYCVTWIAPAKDFAVLVTCNQGGPAAAKACDEAAGALIRHHLESAGEKR